MTVNLTASSTTVDGTDSVTLNASVTNDKNAAGVKFAVSAGTLANATTSSAQFTAPAATTSSQTITVTATSIADATKSATLSLTIPAKLAVTTTSSNLVGAVGTGGFSVQLQGSGGIPPYKNWAVSNTGSALPACLTLNANTGALTFASNAVEATCAAGSPYTNLVFTFQDSGTTTPLSGTSSPLTITISAAPAITFTGILPTGNFNQAYSGSVAASGGSGALTYSIASGSLPPDLALNAGSGTITGTPQAADVGTFNFTVKAADAYGDSGTKAYQLVVNYPQLTITTGSLLPDGYGNSAYSQTLAASGGNGGPYTWTVTSGGSTLTALNLTLGSSGLLSGTPPTAGGSASFTVQAADSASNKASVTFSLTIKPGLTISTTSPLATGYGNAAYSQTFAAVGGTGTGLAWSVTSGASSLAALNLTLSSAGVLSGTPPQAGGSASFSVKVTDSASNTATGNFSLTIKSGITVTAPSLSAAYPGTPYSSAAFSAAGGNGGPYTWSMAAASGSSVPAGFAINTVTGVITAASPVNAGTTNANYNVVITATDAANNSGSANATITIEAAVTITTGTTLPAGTVGVNYSTALAASGGSGGYTWQLTAGAASLASVGLTFNTTTGAVSGASPVLGTATFTVTATDSQSHVSAPATFSVTIDNQLKINQTSLPAGNQGAGYSQTLTASGGSGSGYTFAETTSTLAGFGLSLANSGTISGTPTQTGTVSFTAKVTDSGSNTATQNLSIQVYGGLSLPASNSLPNGYTNVAYSGSVAGSGGSGNLAISITAALAPSNGTLAAGVTGNSVNITGTPAQTGTESITVKLADSTTGNSISQTYSFTINNPSAPSLPATNPPSGTVNQSYTASITATGGIGPNYTWTVNGAGVPSNGSLVSIGSGLSVSSTGNSTLSISGTPSAVGPVAFTASVKDNTTSLTSSTQNYSIQVNSAGSQITGQINWANGCGTMPALPTFSVSINTASPQTVQTDSNGNFTFTAVPNGTYTITPSISGASSVFYPATQSVTVNNANLTNESFQVALGYTVSGTVSYSGAHTGQIYINLQNTNCGGTGGSGTSISSAGAFTIRGVQPGSYTLYANMDPTDLGLGQGVQNTNDPTGSVAVTVGTANVTSTNVTLTNNDATTAPTSAPNVNAVFPTHHGVIVVYNPVNGSGSNTEAATSYDVAWSSSPALTGGSLSAVAGTQNYKAVGKSGTVWILNNGVTGSSSFTDGNTYYFQARANNAAGHGPWAVYGGATPTAVTVNPPSATNTISGNVTIPAGVTVGAHAQLYAGFFSNKNGIYGTVISSPAVGSNNPFTVNVPSGDWQAFAILDQNNDGEIDVGDITNTRSNGPPTVTISGSGTQNVSLSGANVESVVTTQYQSSVSNGGNFSQYAVNLDNSEAAKLPISVELTAASNPNVLVPMDIGNYCQGCGDIRFQTYQSTSGIAPHVGDTYTFTVKYSDGTSDTNVVATVTGWNGGSTVAGPSDIPTNLSPSGTSSTSTTPTFSWTDSANSTLATDSYSFSLYQSSSCSGNCNIWQIPGNNSNSNGFSSATTSIPWNTDPTGGNSLPSVGSLTVGVQYNWWVQVQDSNGNQASAQNWYQP